MFRLPVRLWPTRLTLRRRRAAEDEPCCATATGAVALALGDDGGLVLGAIRVESVVLSRPPCPARPMVAGEFLEHDSNCTAGLAPGRRPWPEPQKGRAALWRRNMTINLSLPITHELKPKITVVGVGGAGGNAVNNMITSHLEGVEFVSCNTDAQALASCLTDRKIQLGTPITHGLGAGARPEVGRAAAEESAGRDPGPALRQPHGVHHRRHGRRHRHRCGAGHRARRARAGHPHRRRGHQALPLRGRAPDAPGRGGAHRAAAATSTR